MCKMSNSSYSFRGLVRCQMGLFHQELPYITVIINQHYSVHQQMHQNPLLASLLAVLLLYICASCYSLFSWPALCRPAAKFIPCTYKLPEIMALEKGNLAHVAVARLGQHNCVVEI